MSHIPSAFDVFGNKMNESQYLALQIECFCIMGVYGLAFVFVVYNIINFLILQKRYKNWLLTAFYLLTVFLMVSRITSEYYLANLFIIAKENTVENIVPADIKKIIIADIDD